jgi:hypothetical protein
MKPILMAMAVLCSSMFLSQCTKRMEGDRRPSQLEEKMLGKWTLTNAPYIGYWEFKATTVDSLCTRTKTLRELDIHIPGFCSGKTYWSLSDDSVLNNSCIPMAKVIKLTKDSLIFRFSSGWVSFDYVWKR